MLILFFCQGNKNVYASSSVFILSSSIYSATQFCIHYHPPLTYSCSFQDGLNLFLLHIFIYLTHTHTHHAVVNVYFCCIVVLSLSYCKSIYTCSVSYKREEEEIQQGSAWIKFFYILEYACVCSSSYEYALFFSSSLYILSIFPFFTPLCNRQMKVKKNERMH